MPAIKCTIIGAGSAFAFHVTSDLIRRKELAGSTIALVDVDPAALETSTRIVRRMVRETGAELQVLSTTDRREALPGSDFVLNSISVGEPWARERDVAIGEKYGIYQPTSQTVGPAGFCRGLRVIPHAAAIAKDIAALCPQATVLDLANPLAAVCQALMRDTGLTVIGLCEQWAFTMPSFAKVLELPREELHCVSVGTNHLTWSLGLYHQGRDLMADFLDRHYRHEGESVRRSVPVACSIYETYGLWPTGSEAHIAEFYNYFLTSETHGGADYGLTIRHTTEQDWAARVAQRQGWADGSLPIDSLLQPSGESAVEIIAQLLGIEAPGLQVVNLPNQGLIDNLPWDTVVELEGHVSPAGVRGLKVGPLPEAIAQTLSIRATQYDLMVEAALTGSRQLALQGLLQDAQVVLLDIAQRILDESLAANAEWLPAFH